MIKIPKFSDSVVKNIFAEVLKDRIIKEGSCIEDFLEIS